MNKSQAAPSRRKPFDRSVWAWALYDWANSAFATTVLVALFPVLFKEYFSQGTSVTESTAHLGYANALASAAIALLSPVLGAIADQGRRKKSFLGAFAAIGIFSTALLAFLPPGSWFLAAAIFMIANIGFAGANSFYDALLPAVASDDQVHSVSAFGFSIGYLGGGLLLVLNVIMVMKPEWFGFADRIQAMQGSIFSVALWWLLFSIPIFAIVTETAPAAKQRSIHFIKAGLTQLKDTFVELRALKGVGLFLLAYFFYIDGVNTIMKMSVDYGLALGFKPTSLILAVLIVQFVGFPATLLFGALANRVGVKPGLYLAIAVYGAVTIWAFFMTSEWEFYAMAGAIGSVQGGVQSLSRSLFSQMIPKDKCGEFFGFFNMLGKAASVMGPLIVAWVVGFTGSNRASIGSVIVLFIIGGVLLKFVPLPHRWSRPPKQA